MKHLLSLAAALAVFLPSALPDAQGAPAPAESRVVAPPDDDPFAPGKWSLSTFGSYRAHELGSFNGKFGAGLGAEYGLARNIALEAETLSEGINQSPLISSLTEAGANFKGYLPLGQSGFAPYGLLGYTRNLDIDENRMNAGAGIEWCKKRFRLFADGRWTHNFETIGHALFRAGAGFTF